MSIEEVAARKQASPDIRMSEDAQERSSTSIRPKEPDVRAIHRWARQVLAQEEARMLYHNYIGTEHLLLALIHEGEGVAAKALESMDIALEAAVQQVEDIIGRGQAPPTGHIPFTPAGQERSRAVPPRGAPPRPQPFRDRAPPARARS